VTPPNRVTARRHPQCQASSLAGVEARRSLPTVASMVWEICTWREDHHDDRVVHVKVRCQTLRDMQDVSLDRRRGVQAVRVDDAVRRQMNAFSKPLEAVFRRAEGSAPAEVVLVWTDMGEQCEQVVSLSMPAGKAHAHSGMRSWLPATSVRHLALRRGGRPAS